MPNPKPTSGFDRRTFMPGAAVIPITARAVRKNAMPAPKQLLLRR